MLQLPRLEGKSIDLFYYQQDFSKKKVEDIQHHCSFNITLSPPKLPIYQTSAKNKREG